MSDTQLFRFNEDHTLEAILVNDKAWFQSASVGSILGLTNIRQDVAELDEDERLVYLIHTAGQRRNVSFVNESGLYALIFKSRKPEAKAFRKWVTEEVLPSIRKTGSYTLNKLHRARLGFRCNTVGIPDDRFSAFVLLEWQKASYEHMGIHMPEGAVVDQSVGQHLKAHFEAEGYDMTLAYKLPHQFPDTRGTRPAWTYPIAWYGEATKWLFEVYFPALYGLYIENRGRRIRKEHAE